MKRYTIIGIGVVAIVAAALWAVNARMVQAPGAQACTQEAKICPDGSAVGRTGPNCTFAACPSTNASTTTTPLAIGANTTVNGTTIGVLSLVEDSRCPVDVQCIQAGTVRVRASIDSYDKDFTFTLGQSQVVGDAIITLTSVVPAQKYSKQTVQPSDYRFTFSVVPQVEWTQGMTVVTGTELDPTVHLTKNERFAIKFGNDLSWKLVFTPSSAIMRVADSVSTDGFQGVYEADQVGTVTLVATGAPICKAGEACPQFLRNVTVTFVIGS